MPCCAHALVAVERLALGGIERWRVDADQAHAARVQPVDRRRRDRGEPRIPGVDRAPGARCGSGRVRATSSSAGFEVAGSTSGPDADRVHDHAARDRDRDRGRRRRCRRRPRRSAAVRRCGRRCAATSASSDTLTGQPGPIDQVQRSANGVSPGKTGKPGPMAGEMSQRRRMRSTLRTPDAGAAPSSACRTCDRRCASNAAPARRRRSRCARTGGSRPRWCSSR